MAPVNATRGLLREIDNLILSLNGLISLKATRFTNVSVPKQQLSPQPLALRSRAVYDLWTIHITTGRP